MLFYICQWAGQLHRCKPLLSITLHGCQLIELEVLNVDKDGARQGLKATALSKIKN